MAKNTIRHVGLINKTKEEILKKKQNKESMINGLPSLTVGIFQMDRTRFIHAIVG